MERYNFKKIEEKWQNFWIKNKSFKSEINPNIGAWLPNFLFLFVTLYIIKVVRK